MSNMSNNSIKRIAGQKPVTAEIAARRLLKQLRKDYPSVRRDFFIAYRWGSPFVGIKYHEAVCRRRREYRKRSYQVKATASMNIEAMALTFNPYIV